MLEKMLKKKRSKTLEESWTDQVSVQNDWLQGNEIIFSKCSKYYSRWMLDNWMLDKRYRMPEESWAWEELMQKAWAQGYQLGLFQGGTISIVIALFPDLEELARSTITNVKDLECLQQLRIDLS